MEIDAASLLNPRVLHFLSNRLKWQDLNKIQKQTIPQIIQGEDTLLIAPTASGKTEAVLIPVFNEILNKHLESMSVLYVSPLKALINDMYERIDNWGNFFNLTSFKWHGDVSKDLKRAFTDKPTDFLLITPESLEVILLTRDNETKKRIFKNLKYIIIDEIHYFADSDRGTQLNSLINRIMEYVDGDVNKIGLSATVGNPNAIATWINHKKPANIIIDENSRKFQYKIWSCDEIEFLKRLNKFKHRKILMFSNSRESVERYYQSVKRGLNIKNTFVHHSSISKESREYNEKHFKKEKSAFMISTTTLELGIDIGNIDIVIQNNAPFSVSSYAQRIGRSGRRSKIQRSIIYAHDIKLFNALAILILTIENKIEDIEISTKSKDIYIHQILSTVLEHGKIHIKEVYTNLKNCMVFSDITKNEFKSIIENMVEIDFLRLNHGFLTKGYEFETKFGKNNFMDFFSVFCPNFEYKIKRGVEEIGSVDASFAVTSKVGELFTLNGQEWRIEAIDHTFFTIHVKKIITSYDPPKWTGEGGALPYTVSRKIYDIFLGNFDQNILKHADSIAKDTIDLGIRNAKEAGFSEGIIPVSIENRKICIYTFAGEKANLLLGHIFNIYHNAYDFDTKNPYYCSFKVKTDIGLDDVESIIYDMENILNSPEFNETIDDALNKFIKNKFINYLPLKEGIEMKIELLFDKKGLIDVCKNNMVYRISECKFNNWFDDEDKEVKDDEF